MLQFPVLLINSQFIGHLHPLFVHLPIGIILFALFISLLPQTYRNKIQPAVKPALLTAAISSVITCITGYLLSLSGEYDEQLIFRHQWTGIATALTILFACFIQKYQRPLIWIASVLLIAAGHWGGVLTHGENFLTGNDANEKVTETGKPDTQSAFSESDSSRSNASISQTYSPYHTSVEPILKSKCYSCHSAVKRKGGLRLDSEKWITTGGKNGLIIRRGDPDNSALYTHLLLPLEDDKHMPPKGKKQLNQEEVNTLFHWIKLGAPFGSVAVQPTQHTSIEPSVLPVPVSVPDSAETIAKTKQAAVYIPPALEEIIKALQSEEIVVQPLQEIPNGLYVNLVNKKNVTPEISEKLKQLSEQIVQLKINNATFEDNSLQFLTGFRNLTQLHLGRSGINDSSIAVIQNLHALRDLNLYGTAITNKSLEWIGRHKNIRKVNIWDTKITDSAVLVFRKQYPDIDLQSGNKPLNQTSSSPGK